MGFEALLRYLHYSLLNRRERIETCMACLCFGDFPITPSLTGGRGLKPPPRAHVRENENYSLLNRRERIETHTSPMTCRAPSALLPP